MKDDDVQAQQPLVLIVDDEAAIRAIVAVALEDEGFRTLEAGNGAEALNLVQALGPSISLIVSDIRMPELDGNALAAATRARFPRLPILLMTGFAEQVDTSFPCITKPFKIEALRKTLEEVFGFVLRRTP